MTSTAEKPYPLGPHIPIQPIYKGVGPRAPQVAKANRGGPGKIFFCLSIYSFQLAVVMENCDHKLNDCEYNLNFTHIQRQIHAEKSVQYTVFLTSLGGFKSMVLGFTTLKRDNEKWIFSSSALFLCCNADDEKTVTRMAKMDSDCFIGLVFIVILRVLRGVCRQPRLKMIT